MTWDYKHWLIASVSLHASLIFMILASHSIYRLIARPLLISTGIGRAEPINIDVVGLPNILKKDLPKLNKEASEEKEPPKKAEMVLSDKESKKIAEKKDNLIAKVKDSVEQENNYLAKIKIIKGMQEQKGTADGTSTAADKGTGVDPDAVPSDPYFKTVKEYVRAYWKVPLWSNFEGLNALVLVKIANDGSIIELGVSQSSGNAKFDDLALSSVKNAAPFPAPPATVRNAVESGVILSFP